MSRRSVIGSLGFELKESADRNYTRYRCECFATSIEEISTARPLSLSAFLLKSSDRYQATRSLSHYRRRALLVRPAPCLTTSPRQSTAPAWLVLFARAALNLSRVAATRRSRPSPRASGQVSRMLRCKLCDPLLGSNDFCRRQKRSRNIR